MGRLLLILIPIVVIAVSASQRERIMNDTRFLREPYYRWTARERVAELAGLVEREVAEGRPVPTRVDFTEFLARHEASRDRVNDPWGTPYYLKLEAFAVRVGSAGKDQTVGTDDDILSRIVPTPLPQAGSDSAVRR